MQDRYLERLAQVETGADGLDIRTRPADGAPRAGRAPDGARLTVLGGYGGWFRVRCGETGGYVPGDCITLIY